MKFPVQLRGISTLVAALTCLIPLFLVSAQPYDSAQS